MTAYKPTHYAIGLVPNDRYRQDPYVGSLHALSSFIGGRASLHGWFNNDEKTGWFVISVHDPSLLESLGQQPFVDQFPVPGHAPEIAPAAKLQITGPHYSH